MLLNDKHIKCHSTYELLGDNELVVDGDASINGVGGLGGSLSLFDLRLGHSSL